MDESEISEEFSDSHSLTDSTATSDSPATSSSSSGFSLPPAKKTKRASKWQDEWKKYNMKRSKRGESYVYCNICCKDFSIASGGLHEVKRHMGSKKHGELAKQSASQTKITAATFRKDVLADQVTAAEIFFLLLLQSIIYLSLLPITLLNCVKLCSQIAKLHKGLHAVEPRLRQ